MVKAFTSHDDCLMPRRLAQVRPPITARMTRARGSAGRQRRPVEAERQRQAVDHRRAARDAAEPHHPADFEADEAAEGSARRADRSAGALEAAADLGEARARSSSDARPTAANISGRPAADDAGRRRRAAGRSRRRSPG